jgi:hypothetical protein
LPKGNDFYEPHQTGRSFRSTQRVQYNVWFESNAARKYYMNFNFFIGVGKLFNGRSPEFNFSHRYRFSDKFSLSHDFNYFTYTNDAGFYTKYYDNNILQDIVFSRRNRRTIENVVRAKFNFNNRSGITFRARHYWSKVEQKQLYDLNADGTLTPTKHTNISIEHQNFNIFNIDAVYTLQFAPGSFLNIVWKDESFLYDGDINHTYFKNFNNTIIAPQNNNLSIKVIYYLDYLDFKKWKKKKE